MQVSVGSGDLSYLVLPEGLVGCLVGLDLLLQPEDLLVVEDLPFVELLLGLQLVEMEALLQCFHFEGLVLQLLLLLLELEQEGVGSELQPFVVYFGFALGWVVLLEFAALDVLLQGRVLPFLGFNFEGELLDDLVALDELLLEAADVRCAVDLHGVELLLQVVHQATLLADLHLQLVVGLQEGLLVDGLAQPVYQLRLALQLRLDVPQVLVRCYVVVGGVAAQFV